MAEETDRTEATAPDAATGDAGPGPATCEPPPFPPTAAAFAAKARDLEALRDAVVDAASVGGGLWFSYIFVLLYLLIAVGSVTHRDLFLESPVKLPFLNVDLPLLGFFVLGPAIFLVVHAYVLLHFVLLAGKVGYFNRELQAQIVDKEVRWRLRRQLPSNIFVQFLAGSRGVRTGVIGFMLRLIAQISLVIGPIALLVFFELQFLAYHNEAISWWHRIAVAADVVLLWMLWPPIARGERAGLAWRDLRRGKIIALAFASVTPLLLVTAIATFPGEWLENIPPSVRFIPWKDGNDEPWRLRSLHELPVAGGLASLRRLLVAGDVDLAARKPKSLWSNRLVLPGFDTIDHAKFGGEAKIAALPETLSLRARHLEGAVLIGAKLREADFTAARLQGAVLRYADLRGAKFECGDLFAYPPQQCAQLQGAILDFAELQGTILDFAQLRGASLIMAKVQGASFDQAQLEGANLGFAQLQGAYLFEANLQGADLSFARLQGADLALARLEGASLAGTKLQAANLDRTRLRGAFLANAELQGAFLGGAELQGALLDDIFVWRADAREALWDATRVVKPQAGRKHLCPKGVERSNCDWSSQSFNELKKLITEGVPERRFATETELVHENLSEGALGPDKVRSSALKRIEYLDPTQVVEAEEKMANVWRTHSSPAMTVSEKRLAGMWQEIGCAGDGAPHVLRGLLRHLERSEESDTHSNAFSEQSSELPGLAAIFLDEERCPGAHGFTDDEKAKLKEIRDRSLRPAPK
jgi:uncharacterized protein YjbI with pentapeptide repeats